MRRGCLIAVLAVPTLLILLIVVARLMGFGPPSMPDAASVARDHVTRDHYKVPGTDLTVSILRKGSPNGRRVIFVHGTPGEALMWEHYLAAVPEGTEMIAVDRPGFGETTPHGEVTSLAEQARALAPLLVNHGAGWPVLVGHSMGGPIIVQMALDNPGKVGSLLILAGSLDPGQEHTYAAQYVGEWPGIRSILPTALRNSNRELMALKGELLKLQPRLGSLACRVAVIHGTKDTNVPYANVAYIQTHFTNARLTVDTIPGRNHFLPELEEPRVTRAIAELVADRSAPC